MKNIKKIETLPMLFGRNEGAKEISGAELEALKDEGINFESYTLKKGDVLEFPAFADMKIIENPVGPRATKVFYVACKRTRNGQTIDTFFNLNSLSKRDIDNKEVYPEFYALPHLKARAEKLAEYGKIWCNETKRIAVQQFVGNVPQYHDETQEDGTILSVKTAIPQDVAVIEHE